MDVNFIELNHDFVIYPTTYDSYKITLVSAKVQQIFWPEFFKICFTLKTFNEVNAVIGNLCKKYIKCNITEIIKQRFDADLDLSNKQCVFEIIGEFELECVFTWRSTPQNRRRIYDILGNPYYTWVMTDANNVQ